MFSGARLPLDASACGLDRYRLGGCRKGARKRSTRPSASRHSRAASGVCRYLLRYWLGMRLMSARRDVKDLPLRGDALRSAIDEVVGGDGRGRRCMDQEVTYDRIMQTAIGFWASKTLMSAVELGIFDTLASGPLDATALRLRVRIHERGARDFFDALVALGLLQRDNVGLYANS